jgi:hypothetical protein
MPQIIQLTSKLSHEKVLYLLGDVPAWLDENDPRGAQAQINEKYVFGGWRPLAATLGLGNALCYPGDPPQLPFAEIVFRNERIFAYPSEFWGIKSADGSVTFARLD